ncbi:MAG TPA: hypothetical protein DEQ20_08150 [Desulfobulbaceae bacterium]|nr:MAG: hypothetical protein A2520_01935 [Deltaproteobacteria bacterium RIFOXYD12_FULL_53_23]HCC54878.1 hypothetical protein [Desulfobulbaceae bacterium]
MRCPKCGYISFDRQKSCGKCGNDLMAVAEQLQGTVGKNAAPFFLGAILGGQKTGAEPESSLDEAEEFLILDGQEAQVLPADEDDFELVEVPLAGAVLEDQTPPVLDLENIAVADLAPLQPEGKKPVIAMKPEAGPENLAGQENLADDLEVMMAEPPVMAEDNEEIHDIFELFLEDGKKTAVSAVEPEKTASAGPDIPDLGLTLEKDDQ